MKFDKSLMASTALAAVTVGYGTRSAEAATCGGSGKYGPGSGAYFDDPGSCTVAAGGAYVVLGAGADGGGADFDGTRADGGYGGFVGGLFEFDAGAVLNFTPGDAGAAGGKYGGGGGGTTVTVDLDGAGPGGFVPLLIGGGGGGAFSGKNGAQAGGAGGAAQNTGAADGADAENGQPGLGGENFVAAFAVDFFSQSGDVFRGKGDGFAFVARVEPIPVPAAGVLLAGGLVSMGALRRRRRKADAED